MFGFLCGLVFNPLSCNTDRFILITFLYNEKDLTRIAEYKECLETNLKNEAIEKIHVIYDTSDLALLDKKSEVLTKQELKNANLKLLCYLLEQDISLSYYNYGRPTFKYCLELANTFYPNKKIILTNADIYFDKTLEIVSTISLNERILTLTRWNLDQKRLPRLQRTQKGDNFSADAWIFETPMRNIECGTLQIGTLHCEGQFALHAYNAGLSIYNPSLSIKCYHLHLSNIRHWKRIPQPKETLSINICSIKEIPQ